MKRMTLNAAELDKYIILTGDFGFTNNTLEQASKHEPWSEIVKAIESNGAYKPVLIFDIINNEFYFGTQENDTLYLQTLYGNQGYALEIQYDYTTDKLTITSTEENYLTDADAPKMYVHHLVINDINYFTIYSSNNLVANTPEKLATLLKDENKDIYYFGFKQTQYIDGVALQFNGSTNLWEVRAGGEESSSAITNINDVVTPV